MDIRLNGIACVVDAATVFDLLTLQSVDPTKPGIAVAVNAAVVPRGAWKTTELRAGDDIEIVRPLNGG
jgi:sulfur carrier protein